MPPWRKQCRHVEGLPLIHLCFSIPLSIILLNILPHFYIIKTFLVLKARKIQMERYKNSKKVNARLNSREVKRYCKMEKDAKEFLERVADKFNLSARAVHKILKISRTIADLEECEIILKQHIAEAVQYRVLERDKWPG